MHLGWSSAAFAEEIIPKERLTAGAASALAPKPPYDNPVVPFDCPDPGVLADGEAFYMVCTGGRFVIRRSDDLVIWEDTGASVLPADSAPWAANGYRNWAPELAPRRRSLRRLLHRRRRRRSPGHRRRLGDVAARALHLHRRAARPGPGQRHRRHLRARRRRARLPRLQDRRQLAGPADADLRARARR